MMTTSVQDPAVLELLGAGTVGRAFQQAVAQSDGRARIATVRTRSRVDRDAAVGPARILVDATPPVFEGKAAQDHVDLLAARLRDGHSVVTCNKAPLAIAWNQLLEAAREGNATIAASATVGGGTPVLATLRQLKASSGLTRIEATLSGTLAFVLDRIVRGDYVADAVAQAQALGLAEPDPQVDLDGTDAMAKAIILHNALFDGSLQLDPRRLRLRLEARSIRALALTGTPAAIATIDATGVRLRLGTLSDLATHRSAPGSVPAAGSTAAPDPSTILVRAHHPGGKVSSFSGPGAGPAATARAMLADVLAVQRGVGGFWP